MNKTVLLAAAVAGVAVVGGGIFYFTTMQSDAEMTRQAFLGDGSVTCTFTDPETDSTGTMYIQDGDVFVDATTTNVPISDLQEDEAAEEEINTYMLLQDEVMYIWTDEEEQGLRFSLEDLDEFEQADEFDTHFKELEDEEKYEETYEEYNYSCEKGARDDVFTLPEDKEFIDINELMQPFVDMMEEDMEDMMNGTEEDFEFNPEEMEEWEDIMQDWEANAPGQ